MRLIGFLIFLLGVYLIIAEQVFMGVLAIIVSILIFPNRKRASRGYHSFDNDYHSDSSYSSDGDSGGRDSGGGGGGD